MRPTVTCSTDIRPWLHRSKATAPALGKPTRWCFELEVVDCGSLAPAAAMQHAAFLRSRSGAANRWGQRVGSIGGTGRERAALFDHDHVLDLGCLSSAHQSSRALAVNDATQVVGLSRNGLREHAFIWQDGRSRGLGELCSPRGGVAQALECSRARALNGRAQVVGRAAVADRVFGFLWTFNTGLLDLTALLSPTASRARWHIVDALQIDDSACILATGVCDGCYHDVLLQARH